MSSVRLFKMGLLATIMMGIAYLIGAFVAASFNITVWTQGGRYFTAVIGVCLAGFVAYAGTQGEE